MAKKQYNYQFDPTQDYSKQHIQNLTGLSKNSVSQSLEVAGLSTSQRMYSGEELIALFVPVRQLLDGGMTCDQIREMRQMNQADAYGDEHLSNESESNAWELAEFDQAIAQGVADTAYETVEQAVEEMIRHIPFMAAIVLKKATQGGKISAEFRNNLREHFAKRRPIDYPRLILEKRVLPSNTFGGGRKPIVGISPAWSTGESIEAESKEVSPENEGKPSGVHEDLRF
jgi:hypothetical protein